MPFNAGDWFPQLDDVVLAIRSQLRTLFGIAGEVVEPEVIRIDGQPLSYIIKADLQYDHSLNVYQGKSNKYILN